MMGTRRDIKDVALPVLFLLLSSFLLPLASMPSLSETTGRIGKPDFGFSVTATDSVDTPENYEYGSIQITVSDEEPTQGMTVIINATIFNSGTEEGTVDVFFFDGPPAQDDLIGMDTLTIKALRYDIATSPWNTTDEPEFHTLWVMIDLNGSIDENNEDNNNATKDVIINMVPWVSLEREGHSLEEMALEDEPVLIGTEVVDTQSDLDVGFTYNWTIEYPEVYGKDPVEIIEHNMSSVSLSFEHPGDHRITLTVEDDGGASIRTSFTVPVENAPPVADFSMDWVAGYEDDVLTLNASLSRDTPSDMVLLKYKWEFGDGQVTGWLDETMFMKGFILEDTYVITLTVRDDNGAEASVESSIDVMNRVPEVDLGPDLTVDEDEEVLFEPLVNDSGSDMEWLTYLWEMPDGTTSTGSNVAVSFAEEATYTVSVRVTDDDGASGTDNVKVRVENVVPRVRAGYKMKGNGNEVTFMASVDDTPSDVDAGHTFEWDLGDGSKADGLEVVHVYDKAGTYTVALKATDDDGAEGQDTIQVKIENFSPQVDVDGPGLLQEDEEGVFMSTASDKDGMIVDTYWDMGDGTRADGLTAVHRYSRSGTFTVTFTAEDDRGAETVRALKVTVENLEPVARADYDRVGYVDEPMEFDASISEDTASDMKDLGFEWSYGDGSTAQGEVVEHIYYAAGEYKVVLTVTDDDGAFGVLGFMVTVVDRIGSSLEGYLDLSIWLEPDKVNAGDYLSVKGQVRVDLPGGIREIVTARDIQVRISSAWDLLEFTDLDDDGTFDVLIRAPSSPGSYKIEVTVVIRPMERSEVATLEVKGEEASIISAGPIGVAVIAVSIGTIGGCVAIGGTDLGRFKFFTFLLPLFTRLKKAKVLDHFDRGRIYEYITKNPGAHYSEIKTNLDLNNGALAYHLKVLEREEYVKGRTFGMYRRFFPFGFKVKADGYMSIQELILETVRERPGIGQMEMAKALGVPRSTINYHCNLLVRSQRIRSSKKTRKKRYYAM